MKTCAKCGETKELKEFGKRRNTKDRRRGVCKDCQSTYTKKYRERNKDKVKDSQLMSVYGITLAERDSMFEEQDGECAICKREMVRDRGPAENHCCIDHDHDSGKVRGLLCLKCNTGIGMLKDNPKVLRAAADYLEEHQCSED